MKTRKNRRPNRRTRLASETLERRELMAADLAGLTPIPVDPLSYTGVDETPEIRSDINDTLPSTTDQPEVEHGVPSFNGSLSTTPDIRHEVKRDFRETSDQGRTQQNIPYFGGAALSSTLETRQSVKQSLSSTNETAEARVDQTIPSFGGSISSTTDVRYTVKQSLSSTSDHAPINQDLGSIDDFFGGYCGTGTWGGTAE